MRSQIAVTLFLILAVIISARICSGAAEEKPERPVPTYQLSVTFDVKKHLLTGTAAITLPEAGVSVSFGDLKIISVVFNGAPLDYLTQNGPLQITGTGVLEIRYEGVFRGEAGNRRNIENAGVVTAGEVSERGIALTSGWYPAISGLARYNLTALVPDNFTAISEADEIRMHKTAAGRKFSFHFAHPSTGLDFIAGNYRETRDAVDGIELYTYFFPEDVALARAYLDHAKTYFSMYNRLFVRYPYKRFSIVENILPTGSSLPTFTLLGQEVLRLPFIPDTSLGHEITHQWFGNYVYADFNQGNWLEAITTYLSDHLYEEQLGKGWEYRKDLLVRFQSYVNPDTDFPLREFRERTGFPSAAIGYGKGALLFHMLENLIGKERFYAALRKFIRSHAFQQATWTDLQKQFEQETGETLGWFFSEWLDRKGVPSFEVRRPAALLVKGVPAASFELIQGGEPYRLVLTVKVRTDGADLQQALPLDKDKHYFSLATRGSPEEMIFDANYDVMRKLSTEEFPPVIARLLGDQQRLIVYPEDEKTKYARLIAIFTREGFHATGASAVSEQDLRSSSFLLLGSENPIQKRLFGGSGERGKGFLIRVKNNPLNPEKVAAYAHADSEDEVDLAANKLFHYGTYSFLRFEHGKNTAKEVAEATRGMAFDLRNPVAGVDPNHTLNIGGILDAISDKPVILIGERHTNYEDHKTELTVIQGLWSKGRKVAIGMEMFQRPFQGVIDRYLAGSISEREFLKGTEYFKRWGFDYSQYREIIDFAKANGIPIVALNQRGEIVDAVARSGIDALTTEEKREIPNDMDMSDEAYKKRLLAVYQDHPQGTTFENFYQSQILWDETMAESATRFLERHPDRQLIVLAGVDHIKYGSGIPNRIHRRTGKECVTLINGAFDRHIGTYVLFPAHVEPPFTAKLGVMIRESGTMVVVDDFSPDSAALKAGLRKGDIISAVNGLKIESVSDLKIALVDSEPGQVAIVKVTRPGFFFRIQKLEFRVSL